MGVRETVKDVWQRLAGVDADAAGERKTAMLPSILTPYNPGARSGQNALPKPTPANLRKFAETPVVRRAINIIKDRVASMDWQVRLKRDFTVEAVKDATERLAILRRALEEPNDSDSFRTLVEQVLEDALVGGFGAMEMDLTGVPEKPFEMEADAGDLYWRGDSAAREGGLP